ncbi:MAG: phosphate acyltransferase [Candidatus Zixiibacteriota bacterium]
MSNLPDMIIPPIHSYEQILDRAKERATQKKYRATIVFPTDPAMVHAVARAVSEGLFSLSAIGNKQACDAICSAEGVSIPFTDFISIDDPVAAVQRAGEMAADGETDFLIKGKLLTSDFLKILFQHDARFVSKDKTISHVAVLKPARYKKLLMVTDGAVVVLPDLKRKIDLVGNIVRVGKAIGIELPRVALLSAVEVVYPQMPVTVEAAVISKMAERGQIKGAYVDGPLSFDIAVDMFAAHSKGVKNSAVAGQADAMVAPNIETANGVYKAMALYGNCQMGGVLVGGATPVALGSRSDTVEGKYHSLALALLTV